MTEPHLTFESERGFRQEVFSNLLGRRKWSVYKKSLKSTEKRLKGLKPVFVVFVAAVARRLLEGHVVRELPHVPPAKILPGLMNSWKNATTLNTMTHFMMTHCIMTHCIVTHCIVTHCIMTHCIMDIV